jgi:transposase
MSAEQSQKLKERRAELEKQLRSLTERSDGLYFPGLTIVSEQPPPTDEQTALQIEELQAAIAEIDEELKGA